MKTFTEWIEKHLLPIATKIGSQKHLVALRDAFIGLMPLTMAGAFATLLNAFTRDFPTQYIGADNGITKFFAPLISINGIVWTGTLAIMAVVFAASLGYNIAKAYDIDTLSGALVSLSAFIIGIPQSANIVLELKNSLPSSVVKTINDTTVKSGFSATSKGITATAGGYFPFSKYMGGTGLFTAMIFGFISVIIFAKLMKKNIIIKMPDSVPPAVSKAFAAILPGLISLYASGLIYWAWEKIFNKPMIDWISETIQAPLLHLSQGYIAVLLIVLLVHVLWFFGLHGTNIMQPVLQTIYGTAMIENTNAFQQHHAIPYKWVAGSFDAFVWPGGAGVTLILLIAIILFSKRADYKTLGNLAIGPAIFNINEPVMFGLPIVLNPIFLVPFILAPVVTATISYAATMLGLVNPVVVNVIWVMPTILNGFLATGGDWRAIVLTIINLAAALAIWAPFVIAANRIDNSEEN